MPYPYGVNNYQYPQYPQSGYQPMYMQPSVQQAMPTQAQNAPGIIWVQGEAGAKSYIVAPGNTVALWDSENQTIYIKSVDQNGLPSMRVIDYTERTAPRPAAKETAVEYVTREEFDALAAVVNGKRGKKKEDKEDEA